MIEPAITQLTAPFLTVARRWQRGQNIAVLCHSDADGLAAGAILGRALPRLGIPTYVEVTGKGENAWSPTVAQRLAQLRPQALIVADLGCRNEHILPGVPTLFLDHHLPEGVPLGATLVTGYGTDPTPTSGLLALACANEFADVADLDWIAAISVLSDLGDSTPFAIVPAARQRHKITHLREATTLLNAARRSATGDARPALDLLLKAEGPKAIYAGIHPETATLLAAKAEYSAALDTAKRAAPVFSKNVALIRMRTPCQVHPLIAQIWRSRLPGQIVISANAGYLPGMVNFSVRSATGVNLLHFLRDHAPTQAGDGYGHGHDFATGGSLSYAAWDEFAAGLGFHNESRASAQSRRTSETQLA